VPCRRSRSSSFPQSCLGLSLPAVHSALFSSSLWSLPYDCLVLLLQIFSSSLAPSDYCKPLLSITSFCQMLARTLAFFALLCSWTNSSSLFQYGSFSALLASHHARTSVLFPSPEVAIERSHLALPNNACSFLSSPDYQAPLSISIVGACWVSFAHSWGR